jgi:DNA-binding HxlR family transcriptional regulator
LLRPGTYILADRWCCLIIAASFLGVRHFDRLVALLGISTNILSARLDALREAGFFSAPQYSAEKRVFEFSPTEKCLDFFPLLATLISWAEKWLVAADVAPVKFRHLTCAAVLKPVSACGACGSVLSLHEVNFVPHSA